MPDSRGRSVSLALRLTHESEIRACRGFGALAACTDVPTSNPSMATPHVSGAAALYAAYHPGSNAAAIKTAILNSAVPTASLAGRTVTADG